MQVTKQSGENTVAIAEGVSAEIERVNREVPGVQLILLNDSADSSSGRSARSRSTRCSGRCWSSPSFSRSFATSDPRSSSARRSRFRSSAHSRCSTSAAITLNTMTFGGLALGIGMIVDAAIVVLENTFRHMEHGKDRVQAAIEGSEEVWSAILASTLTHIAVFIPLLFLSGVSSILFGQLSIVVIFSLAMSLFVAVTIVPVLCSKMLRLPPPRRAAPGHVRPVCTRSASASSTVSTMPTGPCCTSR